MSDWLKHLFLGADMRTCTIAITEKDGSNERIFQGFYCDFEKLKTAFPKQKVIIIDNELYK